MPLMWDASLDVQHRSLGMPIWAVMRSNTGLKPSAMTLPNDRGKKSHGNSSPVEVVYELLPALDA